MQIDGVTLATTPGTFAQLACGDTILVERIVAVGDIETCTDCEAATDVISVLPIEVVPTIHL